MKMVFDSGIKVQGMNREESRLFFEWRVIYENRESLEWDAKRWKGVIGRVVKEEGLRR